MSHVTLRTSAKEVFAENEIHKMFEYDFNETRYVDYRVYGIFAH